MIQITVDNSYSRITGLPVKDESALKDQLSYIIGGKAAYFSKFGPKRRTFLDKKGYFPTGLLYRILSYVYGIRAPNTMLDNRRRPDIKGPNHCGGPPPREFQKAALAAAVKSGRGTISACTGSGKSRIIKMLAAYYGLKTLVIVPTLEIKKQLEETLKGLSNTTVENIDSNRLKTLTDFDVLIIDEAHHSASATYRKLNKTVWTKIYYRFFLTATPFRNDDEEQLLLESIAGQVIFDYPYSKAVKDNVVVPVEAYYLEIPKVPVEGYTYRQVYDESVVNNETRNLLISKLLLQLNSVIKSTLCLVREIEHGKILSEITGVPFVFGQDEESRDYIRQFNAGEIKVLIGTTGVLSEGVDTKPCEYVIIAGLGKAKSNIMQSIGRGLRNYPGKESAKIILIRDASHKYLLRHFNIQKKILLEEYGSKTVRLEL